VITKLENKNEKSLKLEMRVDTETIDKTEEVTVSSKESK
jgi:hypothetical protein